jgi:hypothetical protein
LDSQLVITGKPWYRIIRAEVGESAFPGQVIEFITVYHWPVAQAVMEIWERSPNVKAGKEYVRIVEH